MRLSHPVERRPQSCAAAVGASSNSDSDVSFLRVISASVPPDPAAEPAGDASRVAARIRALQADALDRTAVNGVANVPAALLAAFTVRHGVPPAWLVLWVTLMALVAGALVAAVRGWLFRPGNRCAPVEHNLRVRAAFAGALGALWGAAGLAFTPLLSGNELLYFAVIVLGCNSVCIGGLGYYLPAFFGYCAASALPLALAALERPASGDLALMELFYTAAVCVNVFIYHRQALVSFSLQAQNEAFAVNLSSARHATKEATRSKWNTLAHLSHELRTPLNAILGFSQMMREQVIGPMPPRYLEYSGHILESGKRSLDLIETILDVSRAETGALTLAESEFALDELIAECRAHTAAKADAKRIAVAISGAVSLPEIRADRARLSQAVRHVLTNALQHSHENATIALRMSESEDHVVIAVADRGRGMSADDLARCQEPFVRIGNPLLANEAGIGLGLALARHIVEAHGGRLQLKSEPGRGTTVTMLLPRARLVRDAARLKRSA